MLLGSTIKLYLVNSLIRLLNHWLIALYDERAIVSWQYYLKGTESTIGLSSDNKDLLNWTKFSSKTFLK